MIAYVECKSCGAELRIPAVHRDQADKRRNCKSVSFWSRACASEEYLPARIDDCRRDRREPTEQTTEHKKATAELADSAVEGAQEGAQSIPDQPRSVESVRQACAGDAVSVGSSSSEKPSITNGSCELVVSVRRGGQFARPSKGCENSQQFDIASEADALLHTHENGGSVVRGGNCPLTQACVDGSERPGLEPSNPFETSQSADVIIPHLFARSSNRAKGDAHSRHSVGAGSKVDQSPPPQASLSPRLVRLRVELVAAVNATLAAGLAWLETGQGASDVALAARELSRAADAVEGGAQRTGPAVWHWVDLWRGLALRSADLAARVGGES